MKVFNLALFLGLAWVLSADSGSAQDPPADSVTPTLTARLEVDQHEHSFSVRFFIRNNTDRDVEVVIGRGRSGMEVVPRFHVMDGSQRIISAPTYLGPARRSMEPDLMKIPAGTEILYGTFTMGYPQLAPRREGDLEFYGLIHFRELKRTLRTAPHRLKIPGRKQSGAGTAAEMVKRQVPNSPGQWVKSDNGDLALRLSVPSARIAAADSIQVTAEIRNDRQGPLTILRPCGDAYAAAAVQIKIWGADGRIEYSGPEKDYDLNAEAFVTMDPGEIVTDTIELSGDDFAGTRQAGTYTLRYDYEYDGSWDDVVAKEGVKDVWRGRIGSREMQVIKRPGENAKRPFPAKSDTAKKLLTDLEQEDRFVRAAAIDLLGERKEQAAIPKLIGLLNDHRALVGSDNWVGGHAAKALSAITGRPFSVDPRRWNQWWQQQQESGRK